MTRSLTLLVLACALGLAACPDDEASCVESLCSVGETRCFGNSAATCAPDGTRWQLSSCGAGFYCDAGTCETRACANPGSGLCDNATTATLCSDGGAAQSKLTCVAGETCRGGECVPESCAPDGATRCAGGLSVLTCVSGAWGVSECPGNQVCLVGDDGEAACQPKVCEPDRARCEDGRAVVCDPLGRSEITTACAANEECTQGYCQPKVCEGAGGGGEGDAGATDAGGDAGPADAGSTDKDVYVPPLEPISKIDFTLNGQAQSFDLNAAANYVASEQQLKISASKGGGKRLEINIAPIEPFTVGKWNESDGTDVTVVLCYQDGLGAADTQVEPCAVGFNHAAIAYEVDLQSNNGTFSRVKGTFTATLKNALDEQSAITDGAFDVPMK